MCQTTNENETETGKTYWGKALSSVVDGGHLVCLIDTTSWLTPRVQVDIPFILPVNLIDGKKKNFLLIPKTFVHRINNIDTLICQRVNGSNQMLAWSKFNERKRDDHFWSVRWIDSLTSDVTRLLDRINQRFMAWNTSPWNTYTHRHRLIRWTNLCTNASSHIFLSIFPFWFERRGETPQRKKWPNHSECGRFPPRPITKIEQGAIIKGSRPSSREVNSPILLHAQEEPLPLVIVGCLGLLWLWVFCRYVLQKMILWSTILRFSMFEQWLYRLLVDKYGIVKLRFICSFCPVNESLKRMESEIYDEVYIEEGERPSRGIHDEKLNFTKSFTS